MPEKCKPYVSLSEVKCKPYDNWDANIVFVHFNDIENGLIKTLVNFGNIIYQLIMYLWY